eukprot:CAMPEP_0175798836 /NCGR_PEP_ID=MMETSP0097-20121207/86182_1 /TAXON_ID=311494 /ORGANISM="Alexandrium monilatum, Strain CCMP3105" /LENGTH=258 /DNA_ID=CAMNT_0017110057 /DNA_START=89 /DNA_END=863 /DNA_ORIENTATION=+
MTEGLTVRELKARLRELGHTDFSQFVERADLVRALGSCQPDSIRCAPPTGSSGETPSVGSTWASSNSEQPGVEEDAQREMDIGGGCRLRVAECRSAFDNSNTGAVLWGSSVRLARYISGLGRSQFAGRRVVELGCGTGLAGLAAAVQGAHVILTDLQEVLCQTTEANLEANTPALQASGGIAKLQPLAWGDTVDHLEPGPPFDYVLAADIIYKPDLFEHGSSPPSARTSAAASWSRARASGTRMAGSASAASARALFS